MVQNAILASLHHDEINYKSERISKPFANQYIWKTLTFKQNQKTGKKFEKYNKNVALNFPHIVNL